MIASIRFYTQTLLKRFPMIQISHKSTRELDPVSASYPNILKEIDEHRSRMLSFPNRYQVMSQREDRSAYSIEMMKLLYRGKYTVRYRGSAVLKNPIDQTTLFELLQVVKPATVIELGTFNGGSTLLIDDVLSKARDEYSIYSMDINNSMREKSVDKNVSKNVSFIQGSSYDIETKFPLDFLEAVPRPLLLLEDCHRNVLGVLEHFHKVLKQGDYIVVEDTCPIAPKYTWVGEEFDNYKAISPTWEPLDGDENLNLVRKYFTEQEAFYAVDSYFCDLFGYNSTAHWNAFIRRMK